MVNKTITIFEHQAVSYNELGLRDNDPLFDVVDALNNKSGTELIRLERKGIRANHYVGLIKAGEYLIQILPKIDWATETGTGGIPGQLSNEKIIQSAATNFLHLLRYTKNLTLHNQANASVATQRGTWLEMLTRVFVVELLTQIQQGFHQDYTLRDEFLPYIKGRWNISRQFSLHPDFTRGLDVTFDSYLPDTPLNRVFRLVVKELVLITHDPQNCQMLADLDGFLFDVQKIANISREELDRVVFNRLNERFKPAYQLARLFLEGMTMQLLAGKQNAMAFVFDMDLLFQQLVGNILSEYSKFILPEDWYGTSIELQGKNTKRYLMRSEIPSDKPMFLLKPDIIFKANDTPVLIIDTKNKSLPLAQPHTGLQESDAFQMLAYATEFECQNILLLYPRPLGGDGSYVRMLRVDRTPVCIFMASINLHQPLDRITPVLSDLNGILREVHQHIVSLQEDEYGQIRKVSTSI